MKTVARVIGVSRSNLIETLKRSDEERKIRRRCDEKADAQVLPQLRDIASKKPSYGYRRITSLLRKRLQKQVNIKRVYRLMKEHQLLLQRHTGRPARTHTGKVITLHSNTRWCSDAFGIQCENGEQLQVAFSLDCCDREAMAWVTSSRGIDGGLVRDLMVESVEHRFGKVARLPQTLQWLSDNGPGYTARDTVEFGRSLNMEICTTPPYSPQSNGMAEAFVKTFKRDYVCFGDLSSADSVRAQLAGWFRDYNENAPHKGLGMRSPKEYLREKQVA